MDKPETINITTDKSRRNFLKSAGCLTIGFTILGACDPQAQEILTQELPAPRSLDRHNTVDAWIEIHENNKVRILTGKMELGQGIKTAIQQVAADELNMHVKDIGILLAETGRTPNEGYTAGSNSIEMSAMSVRYAAASARNIILDLASEKLNVDKEKLRLENGVVLVPGRKLSIGLSELLEGKQLEATIEIPADFTPKKNYTWVGKPVPRQDIDEMLRGTYEFVQDLRFDDMVHARIVRPPAYDARLTSFDAVAAMQLPGMLKLVVNGSFVAVVTEDEYQAMQAADKAQTLAIWSKTRKLPVEKSLRTHISGLPFNSREVKGAEDSDALHKATFSHEASYYKPYIMHASNGPSCAVGMFDGEILHIWTHCQGVYPLQESIAALLSLDIEKIHVKGVAGAGCYGHNGADDVAAEVAMIAMELPGRHVRLQWSRQDEHCWEPYGTAMEMKLKATLDDAGKIAQWKYDLISDAHSTRPGGDPAKLLPSWYKEDPLPRPVSGYSGGAWRNAEPYYSIPNLQIDAHFFEGPLRVSALRSLGAYANIMAIESFMDELAAKAGIDPVEFRLNHMHDERAKAVLRAVHKKTKTISLKENQGIGYAFAKYKNSAAYCAIAVQVSADSSGKNAKLVKMWSAIDAGEAINPDGIKNQTEGGMLQSASWTLFEEVKFDQKHISSRDWTSYPILRFADVPEVEVEVIDRPFERPLGAGEAAQGPTAAAILNAISAAVGVRIREVPIFRR
ncbi:MAG: molybdopterin cofactor-binding domain-containing protein [Cyclobacteriaceae bacterium]